ncbi:MAG: hypothetical protein HGA78_12750, partial [Nitrospirales bacterium]|nr:hypothetical protein [Nitrospirales bacterium]
PCVYYRYKIEQLAAGQGRRSGWRVVREGSSDNPFHLGDETGSILVDPADAELLLTPDYQYRDETEMTKYTEWKIMAGDRIYVVGTVRPQRDRASERKERLLERLREARKDRERLSSYDADRDGQISMEEWDRLKGDVEADLLAEELSQGEKEEGYVIAEGDGGPFVISNRSEAELTQRLMLKSLLCLAGGFILIMVMVASLLGRSGVLSMPFSFPWPIILRGS